MYKVNVYITLRENVLDPQGEAAKSTLHTLGHQAVTDVRIGKFIELTVEASEQPIDEAVKIMCERLLVNENVEDYRYEIEEVVAL